MTVRLKDLYLGRADGLQEAEDECFEGLFYKGNQKYDLLCDDIHKFIISGRKGTGKTILAKYFELEMNKNKIPTVTLTKRQFVLNAYLEKGEFKVESNERELFIEYAILREFANLLLNNKKRLIKLKNIIRIPGIIKNLNQLKKLVSNRFSEENFYKTNYEVSKGNCAELNNEFEREFPKKWKISSKLSESIQERESYAKSPYYIIIDKLKKSLFFIMKFVSLNIIFDDLDELEIKLDGNKEVVYLLNTFISVSNRLNAEIRKAEIKNSRIIILIRSDIIKILNENSSNLNKIIADSEIRLNWLKRTTGSNLHPLMELITTKIKGSYDEFKDKTNKEVVSLLFCKQINGVSVIDHMLINSYGRPRDIINMLNIIRNEYPEENMFKSELFKKTHTEYSNMFIDELRNELSTHYDSNIIEEGFKIIKWMKKKTFWKDDIENVLLEHDAQITFFKTAEEYINYAYEYGIIGNIWNNPDTTARKKLLYSWRYREDGSDTPDYNKKFTVHMALRKSLQV